MNQRKHELQKNELADILTKELGDEGAWVPKVLIGLVVLAVVAFGVNYFLNQEDTASADAWASYYAAIGSTDGESELEDLAKKQAATPVGLWAKQALGDLNMGKVMEEMIRDKDQAKKLASNAEEAYTEVASKATDPLLKSRATYGLARAQEMNEKFTDALASYEETAKLAKGTPLADMANKGAARLKNPEQVSVLEWIAKEDFRPATIMPGANRPAVPLPDRPNINLDGLNGGLGSGLGGNISGLEGAGLKGIDLGSGTDDLKLPGLGEKPAGTEAPATTETPAAEAPATETPAAEPAKEAPPAAETPAAEAPAEKPAEPAAEATPPAAEPAPPAAEEKK